MPSADAAATVFSRRNWMFLGLTFFLLGVAAQITSQLATSDEWWLHALWCVSGLAIAIPVLVKSMRRGFRLVLQDHLVMFTGAFALYFLFGASFVPFGQEDEVASALAYYPVDAPTALLADAANAIGFGIAVMVAAISPRRWFGRQADRVAVIASRVPANMVMIVLIVFSIVALSQTLLVDFGFRDGVVAGIWRTAARFSAVAIFLGASYGGRHQAALRGTAVLLALVCAISGFLLFNKTEILVALGALIAGLAVRYRVSRVLPVGLLVLAMIYIAIGGVVSYGRNSLPSDAGVPLSDRWAIVKEGFSARSAGEESAKTSPWGRLCYLPPQVAAMDFYKLGNPSDEFDLIPWLFVPRIIAPDKPVITQSAAKLHTLITGMENSNTGQGIFTGGYYNGGWFGLIVASLISGWLLAQTSSIANAIFHRDALILLPFALLGFYMAFRIDGSFVSDYIGPFIFLLYPLLFAALLGSVTRNRPAIFR